MENIEHAKMRALAQIQLDKEKGVEAFEEYMKVAFPYLERNKKREVENIADILNKEVAKGPMKVRPMERERKIKSKLKSRIKRVRSKEQVDKIYSTLSSHVYDGTRKTPTR